MKVAVPQRESLIIANRAVQIARAYGQSRGWRSTEALEPVARAGFIGMRSPYKHILYQNSGTRARLMTELEGKVIPMGGGRFVRVKGVGTPGYVTLPGGVKVWRDQKWRHPGIKPTHFIENSLEKSVRENIPLLVEGFRKLITERANQGLLTRGEDRG